MRLLVLLALAAVIGLVAPVDGHAELSRADPAPDTILAAPPRTIELWFTEPVAQTSDGDGLSVRVLDQSGRDLAVSDTVVIGDDQNQVRTHVRGITTGTYMVAWSNRSTTDGHSISGSFAFRVASSTRAPGAATTDNENPAVWAVATRWSTFSAPV